MKKIKRKDLVDFLRGTVQFAIGGTIGYILAEFLIKIPKVNDYFIIVQNIF